MMGMVSLLRRTSLVAAVGALISAPVAAQAQEGVVSGKVTNLAGAPLAGASVFLTESQIGTTTNANGNYSIVVPSARARGQSVGITARYIGYSPVRRQINLTAGSQTQNFALKADPFQLDVVVVTGVGEATSLKNTTISVAHVDERALQEVPNSNPLGALAGKVSGLKVATTQGIPGSTPAVRLRGSTNLGLGTSTPLIIVDGVITRSSLSDINANDVESIEVLKGAASANTYGSDAANGVISVTTKRGRHNPDNILQVNTRTEYGRSTLARTVPIAEYNAYQVDANGNFIVDAAGNRLDRPDHIQASPFPAGTYRNQLTEWLRPGDFSNNYVSMSLRKQNTNFATSYAQDQDKGVLPFSDGFKRQNFRVNVDQGITEKADFSAGLLYGLSTNDVNQNTTGTGAGGGAFFALLQSPPDVDLERPNGAAETVLYNPKMPPFLLGRTSNRGNPLYQLANEDFLNRRERLYGSFQGRFRPTSWLSLDGSVGTDRLNRRQTDYYPRGYLSTEAVAGKGSLDLQTFNNVANNSQANATAVGDRWGFHSSTRLTYQFEHERNLTLRAQGSQFQIGQIPDLQATDPTQLTSTNTDESIKAQDFFVTQNLNYQEKYLFQALVRRDGSSLFGASQRWKTFFGLNGGYRVTQDITIPGVQELKIRGAVGTAGIRPNFAYQFETYTLTSGTANKQTVGNKNLEPAVQREAEGGINITFLDRFDAEAVISKRKTTGSFLEFPLSTAQSGGYLSQWVNGADISGRTFELSLNARVIDQPKYGYEVTVTGDRTRQVIDHLARPAYPVKFNFNGSPQSVFYYREGQPLGVMYGARWVRDPNELLDNPNKPAGFALSNYVVNADGYVVLKADENTTRERPIAYVDSTGNAVHKIGDASPSFNYAISNTVRFGNFQLYGLLDGSKGGQIYNITKQWMFQDQRHADLDQASKPVGEQKAFDYYNVGFYNALAPNSYFVENGTYLKLRELNLSYNMDDKVVSKLRLDRYVKSAKLSVIGRNLKTWTKYSGFDPEAAVFGDFNLRLDGFQYPAFRQFTGQLSLNF